MRALSDVAALVPCGGVVGRWARLLLPVSFGPPDRHESPEGLPVVVEFADVDRSAILGLQRHEGRPPMGTGCLLIGAQIRWLCSIVAVWLSKRSIAGQTNRARPSEHRFPPCLAQHANVCAAVSLLRLFRRRPDSEHALGGALPMARTRRQVVVFSSSRSHIVRSFPKKQYQKR